jgi:hypothetical protein
MKVSSHPAQVVISNKDKERGRTFQLYFIKSSENPKRIYALLKFSVQTNHHFIDSINSSLISI